MCPRNYYVDHAFVVWNDYYIVCVIRLKYTIIIVVLVFYNNVTPVDFCQSQTLICLAMWSSITSDTITFIGIDIVSTSCSIHTWIAATLVNVYNNHVQDAARGPGPARDPILSGPRDVPKL